jgi:hypothetical protein
MNRGVMLKFIENKGKGTPKVLKPNLDLVDLFTEDFPGLIAENINF